MYLLPAASFFDIIEDKSCASGSISSIFSILIIFESTGTIPKPPPQIKHPFVFFTILFKSFIENSTLAIVSMTSAVPAALVIALEDVFGIINPAAAQIETTIGVVLFPGIPPMQCLSTTYLFLILKLFPDLNIAFTK